MSEDMNPVSEEIVEEAVVEEPAIAPEETSTEAEIDAVLDGILDEDQPELVTEETTPDPEPQADSGEDEDWETVFRTLRRDNVPKDVIESVDRSVAREWAEKAAKRQGDVDDYSNRLREMEERLTNNKPSESSESKAESNLDFDALRDIVGEDATETIEKMVEEKAVRVAQHFARQAKMEQQRGVVAQRIVGQISNADHQARTLYGGNSPEQKAVVLEMARLGRTHPKSFASVQEMVQAAYRNLAGDPPKGSSPSGKTAQENPKSRRQPAAPKSQPRRQPPPPSDTEDAALDVLMEGGSADDVRRAIRN